jgi:hypothetical protein
MVNLALSEDQVVELAKRLPQQKKRQLALELLSEADAANAAIAGNGVQIIEKDGIRILHGTFVGDIGDVLDVVREERLQSLLGSS